MRYLWIKILALTLFAQLAACHKQPAPAEHPDARAQMAEKEFDPLRPPSIPDLLSGESGPKTPEEANAQLAEATNKWFYGQGLGQTILNVGTVVVFPPYAIYLLGNAGLALAGYEPVYVTDALPEEVSDPMLVVYDNFTEVPGRFAAAVSREKFHSKRYAEPEIKND